MDYRTELQSDIAIVGAGASGIVAALTAKRNGADVCLLEGNDRIGKKILSTGNGKCNLSHNPISISDYYGSGEDKAAQVLQRFNTDNTREFFSGIGLMIRERDGYLYPYSEQASSVLDVLRFAVDNSHIDVYTEKKVSDITHDSKNKRYVLTCTDGTRVSASKVIMCSGGKAAPVSGSDGSVIDILSKMDIRLAPMRPALVKLKSKSKICKRIDGVRAKGMAGLYVNKDKIKEEYGEIQFTKDGISGIPIFNMSSIVSAYLAQKKMVEVRIDLVPDLDADELAGMINTKLLQYSDYPVEEALTGFINKKLLLSVFDILSIDKNSKSSSFDCSISQKIAKVMKNFSFDISETYGFEQAQVTSGGVIFSEVDDNLQSIKYPGLFFAGEILDIDGICGGYNLQWAWSSGYVAGLSAAK